MLEKWSKYGKSQSKKVGPMILHEDQQVFILCMVFKVIVNYTFYIII